jgi:5-(carboxyamino)imidazole ribonucleotide synthase
MNDKGETALFPASEMMVNPALNLLDYQISPALIPEKILWVVEAVAVKLAKALNSPGLFAVEMFIDQHDEVCGAKHINMFPCMYGRIMAYFQSSKCLI